MGKMKWFCRWVLISLSWGTLMALLCWYPYVSGDNFFGPNIPGKYPHPLVAGVIIFVMMMFLGFLADWPPEPDSKYDGGNSINVK